LWWGRGEGIYYAGGEGGGGGVAYFVNWLVFLDYFFKSGVGVAIFFFGNVKQNLDF